MTVRSMRAATGSATTELRGVSKPSAEERANVADSVDPAVVARHLTIAREIYAERRRRHRFLPADLFGEPTWDILIDLYIAYREDRRVPTTSSCIGAHVPPTTALRWLRILEARDLVEREDDGRDGRRTFVRLTPQGLTAMDATFASFHTSFSRAIATGDATDTPPETD